MATSTRGDEIRSFSSWDLYTGQDNAHWCAW